MDKGQGIPVSTYLFFVSIPEFCLAEHKRCNPRSIIFHALDPVGRDGALNHRMFSQGLQNLWRLAQEKLLPAA